MNNWKNPLKTVNAINKKNYKRDINRTEHTQERLNCTCINLVLYTSLLLSYLTRHTEDMDKTKDKTIKATLQCFFSVIVMLTYEYTFSCMLIFFRFLCDVSYFSYFSVIFYYNLGIEKNLLLHSYSYS